MKNKSGIVSVAEVLFNGLLDPFVVFLNIFVSILFNKVLQDDDVSCLNLIFFNNYTVAIIFVF